MFPEFSDNDFYIGGQVSNQIIFKRMRAEEELKKNIENCFGFFVSYMYMYIPFDNSLQIDF